MCCKALEPVSLVDLLVRATQWLSSHEARRHCNQLLKRLSNLVVKRWQSQLILVKSLPILSTTADTAVLLYAHYSCFFRAAMFLASAMQDRSILLIWLFFWIFHCL